MVYAPYAADFSVLNHDGISPKKEPHSMYVAAPRAGMGKNWTSHARVLLPQLQPSVEVAYWTVITVNITWYGRNARQLTVT